MLIVKKSIYFDNMVISVACDFKVQKASYVKIII